MPESPFSTIRSIGLALCASLSLLAQTNSLAPGKSTQAQASSTVNYSASSGTIDIHNVAYEVTATSTPGHPHQEWVLLRKTIQSKEVIGDIGVEATVTVEAWPLGSDLRQKNCRPSTRIFSLSIAARRKSLGGRSTTWGLGVACSIPTFRW